MVEEKEFKFDNKVIGGILLTLIIAIPITYVVTKEIVEKQTQETVLENINIAYEQCQQNYGFNFRSQEV